MSLLEERRCELRGDASAIRGRIATEPRHLCPRRGPERGVGVVDREGKDLGRGYLGRVRQRGDVACNDTPPHPCGKGISENSTIAEGSS